MRERERERETSALVTNKSNNSNLHSARNAKNDEFYTQYADIAKELNHYKEQLKGKNILCPCDFDFDLLTNEEKSVILNGKLLEKYNDGFNFSRFLRAKEDEWNLNLTFSAYNPQTNEGIPFQESIKEFAKKHPDGIIITNPPFSLFREFIETIMECNLKFLIIGNQNAITYKEVFKHIKENKLWKGYGANISMIFASPYEINDENNAKFVLSKGKNPKHYIKVKGITWFTNLDVEPRHQRIMLTEKYNEIKYPKYDNYDAINVNKVKEIPYDYEGYIGVPITFLDKYCPDQFEIIDLSRYAEKTIGTKKDVSINGKDVYMRIIIKNKLVRKDR
ncbi:adenine-specific methyltransferase EcoRI family protein [Mycoplasma sp. Z663]|uniref:adenine-specific methyltransferase EcoRI family protein n=1 Tax=Mycoplasma sp. Z663 TaxID=3401686 RepID=UPI003AACB7DA